MKAIIVDDETKARQLLRAMLADLCPEVEVVADCDDFATGIGRKRSREMSEKKARQHVSFSTGATQKRIEWMNRTLPEGFAVEYVNAVGETEGTTETLHMPISK